jgi:hypothetical protein
MPPVGFEPTIPASERPQTHALDRAATEFGEYVLRLAVYQNQTVFVLARNMCDSMLRVKIL